MISSLRLKSFRAYEETELSFDPEFNRIIGPNGVGKTSLLEAITHIGWGGSPWSEKDSDVINSESDTAIIAGKGPSRKQDVSIKLKRGGRKEVMLCGKPIPRMSELLGIFPMTAVGPQEIDLVKGSPSVRRRQLDSALCQINPDYMNALSSYRKLVSNRNAALKGVRSGSLAGGHILIETIDESLAKPAGIIMEARSRHISFLSKLTGEIYSEIMGGEDGQISIEYTPTTNAENMSIEEITEHFLEKLSARRRRDLDTGETAIGPHRDDMIFRKNADELSRFGSWGQARAASISAILAVSEIIHNSTQEAVTLLLDDCFAELDPDNTERFIATAAKFGQVIIASPRELAPPEGISGALFEFEGVGKIRKEG